MNKKQLYLKLFVLIFFFTISKSIQSQNLKLSSPDKLIEIKIQTLNELKFQVSLKTNVIIENVDIGIEMSDGRSIGTKSKVRNIKRETVNQTVSVPVPNKDKKIELSVNSSFNDHILYYGKTRWKEQICDGLKITTNHSFKVCFLKPGKYLMYINLSNSFLYSKSKSIISLPRIVNVK